MDLKSGELPTHIIASISSHVDVYEGVIASQSDVDLSDIRVLVKDLRELLSAYRTLTDNLHGLQGKGV